MKGIGWSSLIRCTISAWHGIRIAGSESAYDNFLQSELGLIWMSYPGRWENRNGAALVMLTNGSYRYIWSNSTNAVPSSVPSYQRPAL